MSLRLSWGEEEEKALDEALAGGDSFMDHIIKCATKTSMSPLSAFVNGKIADKHRKEILSRTQRMINDDREGKFWSYYRCLYALFRACITPLTSAINYAGSSLLALWATGQLSLELHNWVTTLVKAEPRFRQENQCVLEGRKRLNLFLSFS